MNAATVAEFLAEQLAAWGVEYAFGLQGDTLYPFTDALTRLGRTRFVPVRHEEAGALMASAYGKLTDRLAVCLADAGPGAAHLATGLYDADLDGIPVLAVTGQVPRQEMDGQTRQALDTRALFAGCTAFQTTLTHPAQTPRALEAALRAAILDRRPAHIAIPADLWREPCPLTPVPLPDYLFVQPAVFPAAVDRLAAALASAQRPLILAGTGCRRARNAVLQLAERLGAGLIVTLPAKGAIPETHPLALGVVGEAGNPAAHQILAQSDTVLVLGATWWPEAIVPPHVRVLQVDRDPARVGRGRHVQVGIAGPVEAVVPALLDRLPPSGQTLWRDTVRQAAAHWRESLRRDAERDTVPPPSPGQLIQALERTLPADAVIALDTGDHTLWFGAAFRSEAQHVLVSGRWRTIGFGLPAAIAARLADPRRTVVAVVGDGGFAATMGEFLTAVQLGLPLVVVIWQNRAYAIEERQQMTAGFAPVGATLPGVDFAGYAIACGGVGIRAERPEELQPALAEALRAGRPAIVDVSVARVAPPALRAAAAIPGASL
ncbi:MAG: thiamine pyrophosphate-binding protein [Clostridia bacterium]|nr:thiamine pyrophosphate-binding protein [Clostridia bacterium]